MILYLLITKDVILFGIHFLLYGVDLILLEFNGPLQSADLVLLLKVGLSVHVLSLVVVVETAEVYWVTALVAVSIWVVVVHWSIPPLPITSATITLVSTVRC